MSEYTSILDELMQKKSDAELIQMFGQCEEWSEEALDSATRELLKRGLSVPERTATVSAEEPEEGGEEMEEGNQEPAAIETENRKPPRMWSSLAIGCLILALVGLLLFMMHHQSRNSDATRLLVSFQTNHPEFYNKYGKSFMMIRMDDTGEYMIFSERKGGIVKEDCVLNFNDGGIWSQQDGKLSRLSGSLFWRMGLTGD